MGNSLTSGPKAIFLRATAGDAWQETRRAPGDSVSSAGAVSRGSKPQGGGRIAELDGLRALAALAVVAYHITSFHGVVPPHAHWFVHVLAGLGTSGVNVFFIISGFIITTLLLREKSATGRVSLKAFYTRRFFRIVPPFAVYLLTVLILGLAGAITISYRGMAISAVFAENYKLFQTDPGNWFVAHTGTLSLEEQFYLVFPPLLCLVFRFHTRQTFVWLCAAYLCAALSQKLGVYLADHVSRGWYSITGVRDFRYIIIGVLLGLRGGPVLKWLSNKPLLLPLLAVLIAGLRLWQKDEGILPLLAFIVEPCLCGLLVMWFVQNPSLCAPLRWPAVQWAGACSYSIYLWQQLFTAPPDGYHGWGLARMPLLACAAIIACAAVSHYLVELPCIRLGKFFSNRFKSAEG